MLMATKYKFDMQDARREGMEEGMAKGIKQGKLESIKKNIEILKRLNISDTEIFTLIKESFDIDEKVLKKLIEE